MMIIAWEIIRDPGKEIHFSCSCMQRGVRLYGKYDYYLIFIEKLIESFRVVSIVSFSKSRVGRP
jgi:hypothetical protein